MSFLDLLAHPESLYANEPHICKYHLAIYRIFVHILGYFNNMEHATILDLVKFRLADPNILWLIKKTLTAGVQEEGKWRPTTRGTEQGNLASPVIANIYMHYALAPWFEKIFKPTCQGECGLVIYADDFVATFQHKHEAERFLQTVKERFKRFGLELEPEKTRLIEFGRYAQERRKAKRLRKHRNERLDKSQPASASRYANSSDKVARPLPILRYNGQQRKHPNLLF